MKRHSGRWAKKLSVKEMITNGAALTGPFNDPAIDFAAFATENYGVPYRRAAEWVNIADRFGDRPDLIQGLCETVVRSLASSDLSIADIEQIISDIRTEKIRSDSRSVKQTISEYSKRRKLEKLQREESDVNSETIYVVEGKPFQLSTVEEINLKKSELEYLKRYSEKDIILIRAEKDDFKEKFERAEAKEKQRQAEIRALDKHIQACVNILELCGR